VSGYTGGSAESPTYEQVTAGGTGHREAVRITYDPAKVDYAKMLDVFWHSVDPTDAGGQFCDRGHSYTTAIYTHSDTQQRLAEDSKRAIERSGVLEQPVVTPIEPAGAFYPAEDFHQGYYKKNPVRYAFYRFTCGRDRRLENLWGEAAHREIGK
jgi:peptide-methionine (S)-S-oxide reductase